MREAREEGGKHGGCRRRGVAEHMFAHAKHCMKNRDRIYANELTEEKFNYYTN